MEFKHYEIDGLVGHEIHEISAKDNITVGFTADGAIHILANDKHVATIPRLDGEGAGMRLWKNGPYAGLQIFTGRQVNDVLKELHVVPGPAETRLLLEYLDEKVCGED